MKRLLLASLLASSTLAACTDTTDRYLRVADAEGGMEDGARDPEAWSYRAGTAELVAPGAAVFPQRVTIKIDIQRDAGGGAVADGMALGAVQVIDGSACRLTRAAACDGRACQAELELTQPGVCVVRGYGATPDGEELTRCWYHAVWEGDPSDRDALATLRALGEQQVAACEDGR